jgi:hypothetical protein
MSPGSVWGLYTWYAISAPGKEGEENYMIRNFIICNLHPMVKVKFTIEEAMKTQRKSRGIALLFL